MDTRAQENAHPVNEETSASLFQSLYNDINEANTLYVNEVEKRQPQPKTLKEFTEIPINPLTNIHNVIVYKSGELKFQSDFSGIDPDLIWPETDIESIEGEPKKLESMKFGSDNLHATRSVTKSVICLLFIEALKTFRPDLSLESPVSEIFPELKGYFPIKICDVMNMAVPMKWDEHAVPYTDDKNPERKLVLSETPYEDSLKFLREWLETVPNLPDDEVKNIGKTASYNSSLTALVAYMLKRITGDKDLIKYAEETLFKRLDIRADWKRLKNSDVASFSSGLRLTPNDMLKIGQDLLKDWLSNRDKENPQDMLSLVREHLIGFAPGSRFGSAKYGLQCWMAPLQFTDRDEPITMVMFSGIGGSRICILAEEELVCVITAGNYTPEGIFYTTPTHPTSKLFKDYIFPAFGWKLGDPAVEIRQEKSSGQFSLFGKDKGVLPSDVSTPPAPVISPFQMK